MPRGWIRATGLLAVLFLLGAGAVASPLAAQPEPARGVPPGVAALFDGDLPGKGAGGPAVTAAVAPEGDAARAKPAARFTGPWDLEALERPPRAVWGKKTGLLREVYYEGEPLGGKPTRVFAWYARPAQGESPFPAMLLVHGGGGRAFPEWARLWAERGYAALAMDTAGQGPDGQRLPDGGPPQGDEIKFRDFGPGEAREMWTYHAVAAVVRGHSLLAAQAEVDAERIGITGISWGGYLTCIVTGIDDRLKVSVPVYGCGFLHENSVWLGWFAKMSPEQKDRWTSNFDPSRYLAGVGCPILFVNGTNDFAYPLDSYQKSYRLVAGRKDLSIRVRLPHGHVEGWTPVEIGLFVDSALRGGVPLPRLGEMESAGGKASASFSSTLPIVKGELHWAAGSGAWQQREWKSVEARVSDGKVTAELPERRPLVYYLSITDGRGALASTPHAVLEP